MIDSPSFHGPIRYSSMRYSLPKWGFNGQARYIPAIPLSMHVLHLRQRTISSSRFSMSFLG